MLRFIILLVLVNSLNVVLSDSYSEPDDSSDAEAQAVATSSSSTTGQGTATATSYAKASVKSSKCGVRCGKNEVYDRCPASCPPRTCATKDIVFDCVPPLKPGDPNCPRPKCVCADNYYRTEEGECVLKEQCPTKTCGTNEIYLPCPAPSCANQTCENIGKAFSCPAFSDYPCIGECRCKPGYWRNKIGECISEADCKKCPGKYEYFSCGGACDNECDKLSTQNQTNCPIVNIKCNPMCYCVKGYARDANKICIPISECPPTKPCGTNEIYLPCPVPSCANQTCENIGKSFGCPAIPADYPCIGECRCKPGYWRNKIGECISEADCKKCPGKYEYFSCGGACDNECDKLSTQNQTNCPIVNIKCNPMCYCVKGYARDANKICIPISECPPECKENEEYSKCPNKVCRAKTCNDLGFPLPCLQLNNKNVRCDKPACICKSGFVRNKQGRCIPVRDCPSCGGDPNAWSGCGTFCKRCSNIEVKNPICTLICKINACDCRPGHIYDESIDKCVRPEKCPKQCKKNEEYSNCPNKVCRAKKCSELGYPLPCNQPEHQNDKCEKPACICKSGYVRNKCGECIDSEKCPSCGGDPNAGPGCGTFCTTCDNYKDKGRACPASCWDNGCGCRKGYVYYKEIKKCVLPKQCPVCS